MHNSFSCYLSVPMREPKPRTSGRLIMSDRSMSLAATEGMLEVAADIIDFAKFTDHYGTVFRHPDGWTKRKNALYMSFGVDTFIGGMPFQVAVRNERVFEYFETCAVLGFTAVEVTEDVVPLRSAGGRAKAIKGGCDEGLIVITEIGRKYPSRPLLPDEAVSQITSDLDAGAVMVTIERSEIALLSESDPGLLVELHEKFGSRLIYEVNPGGWPHMAVWLIQNLGVNVNLGNVSHTEVAVLEMMRAGLSRDVNYTYFED